MSFDDGASMATALLAILICTCGIISGATTYLSATSEQNVPSPRRFKAGDKELRQWAIQSPSPVYPRESLSKRIAGVVVASIQIDQEGVTEAAEILQSPDVATGRAVHDALRQWTFKPPFGNGGEGLLVFYFYLKGQKAVVLSPAEMREVTNPGVKGMARTDEPPLKLITEPEFRALSTQLRPVVLDIRDRETFAEGHEKGAVNIPFIEVLTRVAAELPVSRHIVIDCRDPLDFCAMAVHWLRSSGFNSQVSVLSR